MTAHDIIKICVDVSELNRSAIFSPSRKRELVKARQLMAYFIHMYFEDLMSLARIGEHVNGIDHATVLWSVKQIENVVYQKWQPYYDWYEQIRYRINLIKPKITELVNVTKLEENLFKNCVREEIQYHTDFVKVYSKEKMIIFKHLIDLHKQSIEQLKVLI